jgi:hypothetical protein
MARAGCHHDGYREIVTRYDRAAGLLTYYWRCESCGVLLQKADRRRYRPRFTPLPQASGLGGAPHSPGVDQHVRNLGAGKLDGRSLAVRE